MGEIADMMLDGTLCATCGEFIGEDAGYPRYCCAACGDKQDDDLDTVKTHNSPLAKKLVKTLKSLYLFGTDDACTKTVGRGQSLYAGSPWKLASAQYSKLQKRGFVECRTPSNPMHDARAVITRSGIDFLIEIGEVEIKKVKKVKRARK